MRRLYWAVPFRLFLAAYLFWSLTLPALVVTLLNWGTFLLEYRCGGESKEAEELVVVGLVTSSALIVLEEELFRVLAVVEAFSLFLLEFTAAFFKLKVRGS
ncbi:hypothetical protein [Thermococcus pacificus]|uniref:Uncharacterized protein n=1 Tax=Thermococcus pacificus TaxID=71998 RepID=A0A218P865_9EURY|nr:hypothetical protein [Thermococcus pacificus]ASJ06920.1 hypothetical protein A3L08_06080 [Thermococcus pacificus]